MTTMSRHKELCCVVEEGKMRKWKEGGGREREGGSEREREREREREKHTM